MLRISLFTLALFSLPTLAHAAPAASDKSCRGDEYVCPAWMPTQGQVQAAVAELTRKLHDSGRMTSPIDNLRGVDVSTVSCAALGSDRDSNFVCGGESTLRGYFWQAHVVQFSYTLQLSESNRFSAYVQGEWVEL